MLERLRRSTDSIKDWLKQHKKPVSIISTVVVLFIVVGSLVIALKVDDSISRTNPAGEASENETIKFVESPLSGLEVSPELAERHVTAVIIENSPDARPQSGLDQAGVIYEAIAEGGITRFTVFYQEGMPQLIGPVRSIRPYFLDWVQQFDASIAHVGGSTESLASVGPRGIKDLDQFVHGGSYWRDPSRAAPHNVYTSTENLDALNTQKGFNASDFTALPRKDDAPAEIAKASTIEIDVSGYNYNPVYVYNKAKNSYNRNVAGVAHKDKETGVQLSPKVVVVLKMNTSVIDAENHLGITTTGSGTAWVFQDGKVKKGTWSRTSTKSQVVLRNANDKKIKLNKGQTWFTVIPQGKTATYR